MLGEGSAASVSGEEGLSRACRGHGQMRGWAERVGRQPAACVAAGRGFWEGRTRVPGLRGRGSGAVGQGPLGPPLAGPRGGWLWRGLCPVPSITRSAASKADITVSGAARLADLILFISAGAEPARAGPLKAPSITGTAQGWG